MLLFILPSASWEHASECLVVGSSTVKNETFMPSLHGAHVKRMVSLLEINPAQNITGYLGHSVMTLTWIIPHATKLWQLRDLCRWSMWILKLTGTACLVLLSKVVGGFLQSFYTRARFGASTSLTSTDLLCGVHSGCPLTSTDQTLKTFLNRDKYDSYTTWLGNCDL